MLTKSFKSGSYNRCAMILMLCFLCVLPLAAMAGESAIVKGGALNLRAEASLDARVIGQYPTGTWVEILTRGDTWHYVQVGDKTGYMMAKYLSSGNDSVVATATVNTNSRGLNLRVQPSDSAAIRSSRNSQMLPTFRALKPRFCDVLFMGRLIARSAKAPGRQARRCCPPR